MNFRLLGTVDVEDDGRRVALGGPKQRLVLRTSWVVLTAPLCE